MKKLIKDWWPLLLVAGWWLWMKHEKNLSAGQSGITGYGKQVNEKGYGHEWYYDSLDHYHFNTVRPEGDVANVEGGETVCRTCGKKARFVKGHPASPGSDPWPYILITSCSDPNCPSHSLCY